MIITFTLVLPVLELIFHILHALFRKSELDFNQIFILVWQIQQIFCHLYLDCFFHCGISVVFYTIDVH